MDRTANTFPWTSGSTFASHIDWLIAAATGPTNIPAHAATTITTSYVVAPMPTTMIPRITVEARIPSTRCDDPRHVDATIEPASMPVAARDSAAPIVPGDVNDNMYATKIGEMKPKARLTPARKISSAKRP